MFMAQSDLRQGLRDNQMFRHMVRGLLVLEESEIPVLD